MRYHGILLNTTERRGKQSFMKYHGISWDTMGWHRIQWNIAEYKFGGILWKLSSIVGYYEMLSIIMQCHGISWNTMEYHGIPSKTMDNYEIWGNDIDYQRKIRRPSKPSKRLTKLVWAALLAIFKYRGKPWECRQNESKHLGIQFNILEYHEVSRNILK